MYTVEDEYENLMEDARKSFENKLKKLDFLLENGADPRIKTKRGKLPSDVARDRKDEASERVLNRFLRR